MKLCFGSTFTTARYSQFEFGKFRSVPKIDDLIESLRFARRLGFDGIELDALTYDHFYKIFDSAGVRRISKAALNEDIRIPHVGIPFLFERFPTEADVLILLNLVKRGIEAAKVLGAGVIQVSSPPYPNTYPVWEHTYAGGPPLRVASKSKGNWSECWNELVALIRQISDLSSSQGIKFAIEPRPREIISNTDAAMTLLRDVNSPGLGILFDTGHHFSAKEILPISIWKLGRSICCVQLSDNDGIIEHHWAPGEGKIDWPSTIGELKAQGYNGYLAIESSGAGDGSDLARAKTKIQKILDSL